MLAAENYDKKLLDILGLVFESNEVVAKDEKVMTAETMKNIVETIFRKAQTEEKYTGIYGDLCEKLTSEELKRKGFTKVTKIALKDSDFRKSLLGECKNSFDMLFDTKLFEELSKKTDQEDLIKHTLKLKGNIRFLGELFNRGLIKDNILQQVFKQLIEYENKTSPINIELSIEGAVVLMCRVGKTLDDQINSKINSSKEKVKAIALKKKAFVDALQAKFEFLKDYPRKDGRIGILVMNMLDDKRQKW